MSAPKIEVRRVTRPQAKCSGIAIDVDLTNGTPLYAVRVLQDDGVRERTVAVTADESGALRVWNLLARMLGAQRYVARVEGGYRVMPTNGALIIRSTQPRRTRRVALRRRPASRRRAAPGMPAAHHANEREIIARN